MCDFINKTKIVIKVIIKIKLYKIKHTHIFYTHTQPLRSLGSVMFLMFLRESLLIIKAVFIRSKIQKKTVILWNLIAISNIGFLF